ncbi:hypothetical protein Desaci_1600 [Desulfosporosinus acidiphilus SJ4]|uniref:Uncharacterized protein n=1 Tax=Desulfosporosinus acidiphilus (strain DSM 22704 / JCM 16185 / SJ4) TaxID=646529 RepID=I4D479_DESAJ|nr:hypothetical protein Desaci_1600 [Desulfosporosinus acidiphilus SJ4]
MLSKRQNLLETIKGGNWSSFPGVYDTTNEVIDRMTEEMF